MTKISYSGYRFPPEIIQQAIWLYVRFTLSFRDVEDYPCRYRHRHSFCLGPCETGWTGSLANRKDNCTGRGGATPIQGPGPGLRRIRVTSWLSCRRKRPTWRCSMVSVESPPIVTELHRADNARRLPVDLILIRSSDGYGVGRPSVIARQPSEQHLPPSRWALGPRPWQTCYSRPRPIASLPIADTRSTSSTKHSSASTSSVGNTRPMCCPRSSAKWSRRAVRMNQRSGVSPQTS